MSKQTSFAHGERGKFAGMKTLYVGATDRPLAEMIKLPNKNADFKSLEASAKNKALAVVQQPKHSLLYDVLMLGKEVLVVTHKVLLEQQQELKKEIKTSRPVSKRLRRPNPMKAKQVRECLRLYPGWRDDSVERKEIIETVRGFGWWGDYTDAAVIKKFGNLCRRKIREEKIKRDTKKRDTNGII